MCGIIGVYSEKKIPMVPIIHDGLIMEQHRGQEGAGAVFSDKNNEINASGFCGRRISKDSDGSVKHFFSKFGREKDLFFLGMGHTRYSTAGSAFEKLENLQPMLELTKYGIVAVGMNGNMPYYQQLRDGLKKDGASFSGDSDTEIFLKLIARSQKKTLIDAIIESLKKVRGAYSVIFMTKHEMIAARDPFGFRPLSLATFDNGHIFASETCAFDAIDQNYNVQFLRDVEPGEVVVVNNDGIKSIKPFGLTRTSQCVFELIYFARPDSVIFGKKVHQFRIDLATEHAKKHPVGVDCVTAIPDSSNFFSDGHAIALKVPHNRALVRNHYTGRTFINPFQSNRSRSIRLKINPIPSYIENKHTGIDDDSIVRGNTSRKIVRMVRKCKPKSITLSISSPPIINFCPYGIDIKKNGELIAHNKTIEQVRGFTEADDLRYLSLESLSKIGGPSFCYACFDGNYPL